MVKDFISSMFPSHGYKKNIGTWIQLSDPSYVFSHRGATVRGMTIWPHDCIKMCRIHLGPDTRKRLVDKILEENYTEILQNWCGNNHPSLWSSGIGSRLGQNRLWVWFLVVSDIYPMFIEPTITSVPSGFSGCIWLDTQIVWKNHLSESALISSQLNLQQK